MRNQKPCVRCGKIYYHMTGLKYHMLNRQKPCDAKYIDLSGEEIMEDYYKYLVLYNDICKPKPLLKLKNGNNSSKLIMKKQENIQENKQQVNNLIKNLGCNDANAKQHAIAGNNNNLLDNSKHHNNNIYITVNSFGDEDTSHLTKSDWNKIINKKLDAIPELTKRIHIDNEKNHNIVINSVKDGHGKVYNGNKLELIPIRELLEDLVTQMADKLYDYVESNKISKLKQIMITEVLEKLEEENSSLFKRNARDIKFMVVNAKAMIKSTLKNMQVHQKQLQQ